MRDIGWKLWDPIGLLNYESTDSDGFEEEFELYADEYDNYLISAASQLRRGVSREQVVTYLVEIETQHMGLTEKSDTRNRAGAVVDAIFADKSLWTFPDKQGRFK